jgi:hypothetical protein
VIVRPISIRWISDVPSKIVKIDETSAFTARVRELRTRCAKRLSLMERFDKAGLPRLR